MTTYALRPYQTRALEDLRAAIRQGKLRLILCSATGSGKTVTAAAMIEGAVAKGNSVLFLAHRRELVHQCSEKLRAYGVHHGIVMAQDKRTDHTASVQVASIPTLHARMRRSVMSPPPADLIVVDECHHATSKTWRDVLERYPEKVVIGLSATPSRKNGKPLGDLFEIIVPCSSYAELIRDGYLVPTRVWAPTIPDLRGVKSTGGDYNELDLSRRMDQAPLIGDIVKTWMKFASGRQTLCYAVTIEHSMHLCNQFTEAGIAAEHIDGTMDVLDRDAILDRFREGECRVLCNCMVLTEGVDIPQASCAILARPTRSLVLYRQMAGRIQRPAPLKSDAMILDHSGAAIEHGLPDEDLEWDLNERSKDQKKADAQQRKESTVRCRQCGYMAKPAAVTCPQCGATLPRRKTKLIRHRPGELRELTSRGSALTNEQSQRLWTKYIFVAKARGQRIVSAEAMFKRSTGKWPNQANVYPRPDATDRNMSASEWYERHRDKVTT